MDYISLDEKTNKIMNNIETLNSKITIIKKISIKFLILFKTNILLNYYSSFCKYCIYNYKRKFGKI